VGVVVSDTSGRAWRTGQTDIAIGAAGVIVLDDHTGRTDGYGNPLSVTAPAIVDEVAAMAELATGKLGNAPAALVRGLDRFVLPAGTDGPGARALVREPAQDMFALGTREAVLHALLGTRPEAFGAPAAAEELVEALAALVPGAAAERRAGEVLVELRPAGASRDDACLARLAALAHAYGWRLEHDASPAAAVRFRPATP
jgi:coenzyme F420-0:L-glutamate ligase/coenzyme F420-1:gamma-L-glutamate ligase